jgi:hypothetical protein
MCMWARCRVVDIIFKFPCARGRPSWCLARDFCGWMRSQQLLVDCYVWIMNLRRERRKCPRVDRAEKLWVRNCMGRSSLHAVWRRLFSVHGWCLLIATMCPPRVMHSPRIFHSFRTIMHAACCLTQGQRHLRKVDAHSLKWGEKCLPFVRFNCYELGAARNIIAYFLMVDSIWKLIAPVALHSTKTVNTRSPKILGRDSTVDSCKNDKYLLVEVLIYLNIRLYKVNMV